MAQRPPTSTAQHSRRDALYDLLRQGPVTYRQLKAAGLMRPHVHVESLELEGHRIQTDLWWYDAAGVRDTRFELTHDAWADSAPARLGTPTATATA